MCLLASPRLYPLLSCLVKAYTQRLTICFYGIKMSNIDHSFYCFNEEFTFKTFGFVPGHNPCVTFDGTFLLQEFKCLERG